MLNIIIAYDNLDTSLGDYFTACKDDMVGYLTEQIANGLSMRIVEIIDSRNCHSAYIDLRLKQYQEQALLFIAYSHGLPHSLQCSGNAYIHHTDNVHLLFNSVLYTNACSTSKELGRTFHNQNGVSIGFDEEVRAFKEESGMMETSINCDNCGLKYGINHPETTFGEIFRVMKNYYSNVIDKYLELEGPRSILATEFIATRSALKIHGNKEMTLNQFINQF
jgi:transcription elongation factor Elf1